MQSFHPVLRAVLDLVKLVLHVGCELRVNYLGKVLLHKRYDNFAEVGRFQRFSLALNVLTCRNGRNCRSIGTRSADTVFFKRLDERSFRVARRRLGEVLISVKRFEFKLILFF